MSEYIQSHCVLRMRLWYRRIRKKILQIDPHRIVVRPLCQEDVSVLDRHGDAAINHSYIEEWHAQCVGEITMLVAWYGQRPLALGFVHWAGPRQQVLQALHADCPEIFRLHVHRLYRSMGLGTLIINEFERLVSDKGYGKIGLGVADSNPAAHALYQRLGYGEPVLSEFVDEFFVQNSDGRRVCHSEPAHFLVKHLSAEEK